MFTCWPLCPRRTEQRLGKDGKSQQLQEMCRGHLAGHVVITQCHFSSRYLRIIGNKKVLRIGENLSSRKLYILVKDKIKARDCTSEVSDKTGLNNRGEQTKL